MEERRYLISDAAKMVAVEAHVLRYWEEELGLSIGRTELGHRYYTRENIELFQKVKKLKEEGLQLRAIRVVLQNTARPEDGRLHTETLGEDGGIPGEFRQEDEGLHAQASRENSGIPGEFRQENGGMHAQTSREDSGIPGEFRQEDEQLRAQTLREGSCLREAPRGDDRIRKDGGNDGACAQEKEPGTAVMALRTNAEKLEQFTELVEGIVEKVVRENNEELQRRLEESMARETSYLLHMQDKRAEEHFRQLDETIRERQKNGRYVAAAREKRSFWDRLRRR